MEQGKGERGFTLLSVTAATAILTIASVGLAGSILSAHGLSTGATATMGRVASAENVLERLRDLSISNFNGVVDTYQQATVSDRSSFGVSNVGERKVLVNIPLNEGELPRNIDLNMNGLLDAAVDPASARALMVDIEGPNSFRLRTVVINYQRLTGVHLGNAAPTDDMPVSFGETRDGQGTPTYTFTPSPLPVIEPGPLPTPQPSDPVLVVGASGFNGKTAEILVTNAGIDGRRPTAITIVPDEKLGFEQILIDGKAVYTGKDQAAGAVTVKLDTGVTIPPGESKLSIGPFYRVKKGKVQQKRPKEVVVTIAFDDGSVVSTTVRK